MTAIYSLMLGYLFQNAAVHFHMLRNSSNSHEIHPSLHVALQMWTRTLAPDRKDRRGIVRFHIGQINRQLASRFSRKTLISARNGNIRLEYNIPKGTSFIYSISLFWSIHPQRRRIDLTLIQVHETAFDI